MGRVSRCLLAWMMLLGAVAGCEKEPPLKGAMTLYDGKGMFGPIEVKQAEDGLRTLVFDHTDATQTALYPDRAWKLMLPYAKTMVSSLAVKGEPGRLLVVGLGGGALPSFVQKWMGETKVTTVEIDPAVIRLAKKYFGYKPTRKNQIVEGDGRAYIEKNQDQYDLIWLDAYGAEDIPPSLATVEFLRRVKSRMAAGGVLAANIPGPSVNDLYDRMIETYRAVFAEMHLIQAPGNSAQRILICTNEKMGMTKEKFMKSAEAMKAKYQLGFDLKDIIESGYMVIPTARPDVKILVD